MEAWSAAVLEWVNCLDILEKNIDNLKELRDCKFYSKLIKTLSRKDPAEHDLDDKDLVFKFIQDEYPEFFAQSEGHGGSCKEIHVASLLLIHSSHEPKLHKPMCIKLSNETQLKIKSFLEKVLQYGSNVRREDINEAIMEITENAVRTPPVTPKMRPLKDFFNSPVTTIRKNYSRIMDERTREVRRLKAELETERFEKADLQEDLQVQREKISNLHKKLHERMEEIKVMRTEPTILDTPQSSKKKREIKTPKNRVSPKVQALMDQIDSLKFEINNLEDEKESLSRKLASTERHCTIFKERSDMNERNLETLLLQVDMKEREIEGLRVHNEELRAHIQEIQRQTVEDQSFEMEMTATSTSNSVLNESEVLSSVIDIQLQEAKKESILCKSQLEELRCRLQIVQEEHQALQSTNKTLAEEVSLLQSTRQELSEVKKGLDNYIEKSITLERESLQFKEESTKFSTLLLSKEKLLEESEHQKENLKYQLSALEDKLETAWLMLSQESSRVKNLEELLTKKNIESEEMLERECSRSKALEEKYEELKQEEAELQRSIEDLKNLVSSKDESLEQAQQLREILESDVRDLKGELKTVRHSLSLEATKVEDLQSTMSRMKVEHKETLEKQLLDYRKLENKYTALDEEKSSLVTRIEELNEIVLSKERLLEESRRGKENLEVKLEDLSRELGNIGDMLSQEKSKVEILESTMTIIKNEKEEALESQMRRYRDLEEKHVNLESEKSKLLTQLSELKSLVASKEELFDQLEQKNVKFESDLLGLRKNLEVTQDLLNVEKIRVESLESETNELKTRYKETIQGDLLKYQELEKRYTELEEEKIKLLQKNEDLDNTIISRNDLLEQVHRQNEKLSLDLRDLNENLETVQSSLTDEKTRVKELESSMTQVRQEKEELAGSQLSKYQDLQGRYVKLEEEKVDLMQKNEDLSRRIASKIERLEQAQQQNNRLLSNLEEQNDKLKTALDALSEDKNKIKEFESLLTQARQEKEETLDLQLLKYQDLKEKYVKLEQEKLDLQQKIINLNHSISTKEDMLTQSQINKEKLERNLQELNGELQTVQNSLINERTKVEALESTVTCMNREREESLQRQSSSYQALEKKHMNLTQERTNLLEESEDLRTQLSSKVELLQQSEEQKAKLDSELCDVKDKMKAAQNELSTAITKVKNLESVLVHTKLEMEKIVEAQSSESEALQRSNESLRAEISSLENDKQGLCETQGKLNKQSEELQQEKSRLLKDIQKLEAQTSIKEDLLKETQRQNEDLESKLRNLSEEVKEKSTRIKELESVISETERERKESLCVIEELKFANTEQKNLIQSCSLLLKELVMQFSQINGDEVTDIDNSTLLDLSEQLKTILNSMKVSCQTKDSDLESFKATVDTLNSTVSKLKIDVTNFEETKTKDAQLISEYSKKIADLEARAEEKETLLKDVEELRKELLDEKSKTNMSNEEKKFFGKSLIDAKQSLNYLKNEKIILIQNIRKQDEDFLVQMSTLSEIIAKLEDQIILKNKTITSLCEEKIQLTSMYEEEKKVRANVEGKCESLENENRSQTKEMKELKDKLNTIRVRNAKLEKNLDELRKEKKRLETEKQSTEENEELDELKSCIAKLQLEKEELETEKIELSKRPTQQHLDSCIKEVHYEYDHKLERLKQKMKSAYNEQIAKVNRDQERFMQEKLNAHKQKMEEMCRKHAEEIKKYKDHVTRLSSQFWDVGEKLLVEKQQKENFAAQLQDMRKGLQCERTAAVTKSMSQSMSSTRSGTASLDRRDFSSTSRDEMSTRVVSTIKEEFTVSSRRESIQNVQSVQMLQGMGNAFKIEDEEGEVFNTNYLADMKAGRCSVAPDMDRLSVLQMRNAQCKPHLKSSYPAETQFQPEIFTEEEIKSGSALEDVFNDSLSQSLLPGEKTRKRDRTQTLYKRPGPPTPSKNGGRLSLQGNELKSPSSRILKERNTDRRSTATPRRIKDFFGGNSRRQDENVSGTPTRSRLSNIFRKPK